MYGPYPHARGWVVRRIHDAGRRQATTRAREADAESVLADWAAEARDALPVTMSAANAAYYDHLRAKGRKGGTLDEARWRLGPLEQLVDHVQQLTRGTVERRLAGGGRQDSRAEATRKAGEELPGLSVATRLGTLARMRDACRYWISRGWIHADPTAGVEVEGTPARGKLTLTPREVRALLGVLVDDSAPASTAVALALLCGLRRGEVLALRVRDVDTKGRPPTVTIASGWTDGRRAGKTEAAVRTRPVDLPWLAARLARLCHRRQLGDLVFRSPRTEDEAGAYGGKWLAEAARRYARSAQLEEERVEHLCAHGLRGTWRHLQLLAGASAADVARAAGHTGERVGREHYAPGSDESVGAGKVQDIFAPAPRKRTGRKGGKR